jgi:putative membrane protein
MLWPNRSRPDELRGRIVKIAKYVKPGRKQVMEQVYLYAIHLLSAFILLAGFAGVYLKVTPFDELAQIRAGNVAAVLSLSGALLGFSLTLASSIVHYATLPTVVAWAVGALLVQLVVHAILARILPGMDRSIEANNVAMGGLMGAVSLTVGALNAACLS